MEIGSITDQLALCVGTMIPVYFPEMPLVIIKSDRRAREKPCLRCGYSLRKLIDAKRCPECGLPIFISLGNNQTLDWSNPAWVRKVSIGCWLLASSQILLLAITISFTALSFSPRSLSYESAKALYLAMGAYLVLWHGAMAVLAWPEMRFPDKDRVLRISLRVMACVGVLTGAVFLYGVASGNVIGLPLWTVVLPLGLLLSHGLNWGYLRTLARRLPSRALTRTASIALGFLLVTVFVALYGLGLATLVYLVLPWIYIPPSAAAFAWFALAFRRAENSAAENWAIEV